MQVAGTFNHSPTSPIREPPFILTDPQHSGFESPGLMLPRHIPDTTPRLDSTGPVRRRRTSKSLSNSALKRSASTPNVRSSSQSDMPSNMLNDKKRNKLGYHRTSVACVHCRRRKIRCLLAPDDPQNRCANCIRLKKECNFYPVDQQPPHEKRSRTGSKTETHDHHMRSNGHSSPSSSPEFATGATMESVADAFNPYHHPAAMGQQPYPTGPHPNEPSAFSPPSSAAAFSTNFDFANQRQPWDQHNGHPHIQQQRHYDQSYHSDPSKREFWPHQPETPISPAYSYPPVPPNDQSSMHDNNASHPLYALPRTGEAMHPARSMSFSHIENLQHENDPFHAQGGIMIHDPHQRRATATSDMLPPSLRDSAGSSMASITDVPPITYGGPTVMPPQTSSLPFGWTPSAMPHSSQSPKSTEFAHPGTMWPYADQGGLPKLQEEQEARIGYVQEAPMLYSNAPHR